MPDTTVDAATATQDLFVRRLPCPSKQSGHGGGWPSGVSPDRAQRAAGASGGPARPPPRAPWRCPPQKARGRHVHLREVRATQSPGRRHRSRRRCCPDGNSRRRQRHRRQGASDDPTPNFELGHGGLIGPPLEREPQATMERRHDRHERHRHRAQHDEAVVAEPAMSPLVGHHDGQLHLVELVDEPLRHHDVTAGARQRVGEQLRAGQHLYTAVVSWQRDRIHSRRTRARRTAATPSSTIAGSPSHCGTWSCNPNASRHQLNAPPNHGTWVKNPAANTAIAGTTATVTATIVTASIQAATGGAKRRCAPVATSAAIAASSAGSTIADAHRCSPTIRRSRSASRFDSPPTNPVRAPARSPASARISLIRCAASSDRDWAGA